MTTSYAPYDNVFLTFLLLYLYFQKENVIRFTLIKFVQFFELNLILQAVLLPLLYLKNGRL